MKKSTKERLIGAASDLLDRGGVNAVTLRAVAEAVQVSHNAPYRHFRSRNALLAGVAERDFGELNRAFQTHYNLKDAKGALKAAAKTVITYARKHPARYRLLFSDPDIAQAGGSIETAAFDAFQSFHILVEQCQKIGKPMSTQTSRLAGLIYATLHGAIDIELGGRAKEGKGLGNIEATVDLLLNFLWPVTKVGPKQRSSWSRRPVE
jgi:AcrR family transcriptional regulator